LILRTYTHYPQALSQNMGFNGCYFGIKKENGCKYAAV
jgi:hypothetical protein